VWFNEENEGLGGRVDEGSGLQLGYRCPGGRGCYRRDGNGNTVYVIGDGGGLHLEGFTAAAAARQAGKWISVGPSSPVYGPTAAGLTVSTTIDLLNMEGPVTELAGTRLLGYRTLGFKGTSEPSEGQPAAPERIYVRSTGTPLPVEAIEDGTTTLFDDWGEPVNVSVPLGAVLIQSSWLRAR